MRSGTILLTIVPLLLCTSANANDTLATLGAGGLVPVKSTQIALESEDLKISAHRITVRYVFRNASDKDVHAIVAFPLPDLDGVELYFEPMHLPRGTDWNFVDFKVSSNGEPVSTRMEARAFIEGRDITARLRAVGLPVSVLLEPLNYALMELSARHRDELEKERLITSADFNPPLRSTGTSGWYAGWTMRVKFYWTQRFPAHSPVELVQTYTPVVGGSYIFESDKGESSVKPYCGGGGDRASDRTS